MKCHARLSYPSNGGLHYTQQPCSNSFSTLISQKNHSRRCRYTTCNQTLSSCPIHGQRLVLALFCVQCFLQVDRLHLGMRFGDDIEILIFMYRCMCNGHGDECDVQVRPYQCKCFPNSYTEGNQVSKSCSDKVSSTVLFLFTLD